MAYTHPVYFWRHNILKDKKIKKECTEEFYPETNRPLIRPQVSILKAVLLCITVLAADVVISIGILHTLSLFSWYDSLKISFGVQLIIVLSVICLISLIIFAKKIVIFVIKIYQRYAPYHIRSCCLFIPNCSEYMRLAIEKYGLIRGIRMGIARYRRCCAPNGGEDYP